MAKFIWLSVWGVDAEGSLESGIETRNYTNSNRRSRGGIYVRLIYKETILGRSLVIDTSDPKVKNSWDSDSLMFGGR